MRGRIYERRSDLSPDGKHLIYFAMNGRWDSETKGAWTAISRVPYLKAVNLYAKGDCWNGGGLFLSDAQFWLNDGYGHTQLKASSKLKRNAAGNPPDYFGGECLTIYYNRLQRDGWTMHDKEYQGATLFEKKLPGSWLLRKLAFAETGHPPGRGCYWDAHELRHEPTGTVLAFPEWEWADFVNSRLVWATEGQLRTARLGRGQLLGEKLLHDFNDMKFEAIAVHINFMNAPIFPRFVLSPGDETSRPVGFVSVPSSSAMITDGHEAGIAIRSRNSPRAGSGRGLWLWDAQRARRWLPAVAGLLDFPFGAVAPIFLLVEQAVRRLDLIVVAALRVLRLGHSDGLLAATAQP